MRGISSPQSSDDPLAPSAPDSLYGGVEVSEGIPIRVTAVRGRGFHISKRRIRKDDVPDVYCTIKVNSSREGAPRAVWKTATIKDDTMPQWNESREFTNIDPSRDIIRVDVFDENRKGKDEYLGSAEITVEKLLRKRMMELELQDESVGTNTHITVRCIELVTAEAKPSQHHLEANGNTALHYACRGGNCESIKWLLNNKFTPLSTRNGDDKLPIQLCCEASKGNTTQDDTEYVRLCGCYFDLIQRQC